MYKVSNNVNSADRCFLVCCSKDIFAAFTAVINKKGIGSSERRVLTNRKWKAAGLCLAPSNNYDYIITNFLVNKGLMNNGMVSRTLTAPKCICKCCRSKSFRFSMTIVICKLQQLHERWIRIIIGFVIVCMSCSDELHNKRWYTPYLISV